jgi:hypothetical protein
VSEEASENRALFQFFAQGSHIYAKGLLIGILGILPDIFQDVAVGQNLSRIPGQETQQPVLNGVRWISRPST